MILKVMEILSELIDRFGSTESPSCQQGGSGVNESYFLDFGNGNSSVAVRVTLCAGFWDWKSTQA